MKTTPVLAAFLGMVACTSAVAVGKEDRATMIKTKILTGMTTTEGIQGAEGRNYRSSTGTEWSNPNSMYKKQCLSDEFEDKCKSCMCTGDGTTVMPGGSTLWCDPTVDPDNVDKNIGCVSRKELGKTCKQNWECKSWRCTKKFKTMGPGMCSR